MEKLTEIKAKIDIRTCTTEGCSNPINARRSTKEFCDDCLRKKINERKNICNKRYQKALKTRTEKFVNPKGEKIEEDKEFVNGIKKAVFRKKKQSLRSTRQ